MPRWRQEYKDLLEVMPVQVKRKGGRAIASDAKPGLNAVKGEDCAERGSIEGAGLTVSLPVQWRLL